MSKRSAGRLSGLNVLITEDDLFVAVDLAETLEEAGALVIGPVSSVARAITLLENEEVDAAVLDISLRSELAFPLADMLSERRVPFLFATGCNPDIIPEAHAQVPLAVKPSEPARVVDLLSKLVRRER